MELKLKSNKIRIFKKNKGLGGRPDKKNREIKYK